MHACDLIATDAHYHAKALQLWGKCKPLTGTKGEANLRGQGITCFLPPSLAWSPDLFHAASGRFLSAIVADVSTGGVSLTFVQKNGQPFQGRTSGTLGPCDGGAVTLSEGPGPLVVCEGLLTGLRLLSGPLTGSARVWAAVSSMQMLHLPPDPSDLFIAIDADDAGREAGRALAERAAGSGWAVSLLHAPDDVRWNGVLARGEGAFHGA